MPLIVWSPQEQPGEAARYTPQPPPEHLPLAPAPCAHLTHTLAHAPQVKQLSLELELQAQRHRAEHDGVWTDNTSLRQQLGALQGGEGAEQQQLELLQAQVDTLEAQVGSRELCTCCAWRCCSRHSCSGCLREALRHGCPPAVPMDQPQVHIYLLLHLPS
jgi:hypothetical protein